jgi:Lipase (class 3)
MSYTPPYSNFVANLQGTHYGLVALGLATAAYTYEGYPLSIAGELASVIQGLPQISDISGTCCWNLDWGPAICTNNGGLFNDNLLAIVSYRQGSASGTPYFFAVLCRGTDIQGGIAQLTEDLDAFTQQSWTDVLSGSYTYSGIKIQTETSPVLPTTKGMIASGSADALIAVTNLVPYGDSSNDSLATGLLNLLNQYPGTPVLVTGHSLGGALTQVVSAYLSWQCSTLSTPVPVIPQAFAPPTVGDSNFASYYDALFKNSGNFWVNNADLVPCAFAQPYFHDAGKLWRSYKWPTGGSGPSIFGTGIEKELDQETLVHLIAKHLPAYARPSNVQSFDTVPEKTLPTQQEMQEFLEGMQQNTATWQGWASQLEYQHFPPRYYALLSTQVKGILPYGPVVLPAQPLPGILKSLEVAA